MNELIDLVTVALRDGCGMNFADVVRTTRYEENLRRFSNGPAHLKAAGYAPVVELGLWEFATAVTTLGPSNAMSLGVNKAAPLASPEDLALIATLGECIIETAQQSMPNELKLLAEKWKTLDPDEQREELFTMSRFLKEDTKKFREVSDETEPVDDLFKALDVNGCLPKQFIHDGTFQSSPGCLGLAMVLTGFAASTGARYYVCSYIEHRTSAPQLNEILWDTKNLSYWQDQGFEVHPDIARSVRDGCTKSLAIHQKISLEDFHYALVIQCSDDAWMLVDPFQQTVAPMGAAFGVDEAAGILRLVEGVYPGLTVICDDGGRLQTAIGEINKTANDALARAASLAKMLVETLLSPDSLRMVADKDFDDGDVVEIAHEMSYFHFEDAIKATEAALWYEYILRTAEGYKDIEIDFSILAEILGTTNTTFKKYGKSFPDEKVPDHLLDDVMLNLCFVTEERFDEESPWLFADRILTVFSSCVKKVSRARYDAIWGGRIYPHPVIELMNPAFALGLSVLNQIRCWTETVCDGKVFLSYGASQQFWHEATVLTNGLPTDTELLRIEELVRMLPFHYPIVANKLGFMSERREGSNAH